MRLFNVTFVTSSVSGPKKTMRGGDPLTNDILGTQKLGLFPVWRSPLKKWNFTNITNYFKIKSLLGFSLFVKKRSLEVRKKWFFKT